MVAGRERLLVQQFRKNAFILLISIRSEKKKTINISIEIIGQNSNGYAFSD